MEYLSIRVSDLIRNINKDLYLPAIQRELVWETGRIERLFDSIMADFPIGGFLFWKLEQQNRDEWPIYKFIQDYNEESPHNPEANLAGITRDIQLVIDGQQRIASLFIGLGGSYRYFYYRWRNVTLYLDLLKLPENNEENPEELTYGFAFRENATPSGNTNQLWYPVGRILDFEDAEDAKSEMRHQLQDLSEEQQVVANKHIGRLHNRIHTTSVGNYYLEKSQNYDKILQVFIRANSGGKQLEYSDLLLATATAKWQTTNARSEIHDFTDALNEIGNGFKFGKDFVLKSCLYLCETLPIQYKIRNFTESNLRTIEDNWGSIKDALTLTVKLISNFGFHSKNVVAPLALLPIAYYVMKRGTPNFDTSSEIDDTLAQESIRKWFIFSTLKNAFGGSSDTTLNRLRSKLKGYDAAETFPATALNRSLEIKPSFDDEEINHILDYKYQGRYTMLILSLLYPEKFWKDNTLQIDHIYPQSQFTVSSLRNRGYVDSTIDQYMANVNTLCNLNLLSKFDNQSKGKIPFAQWIKTRDGAFRLTHLIPDMVDYSFDNYLEFVEARKGLIKSKLSSLSKESYT